MMTPCSMHHLSEHLYLCRCVQRTILTSLCCFTRTADAENENEVEEEDEGIMLKAEVKTPPSGD